jgi:hypothetical protein
VAGTTTVTNEGWCVGRCVGRCVGWYVGNCVGCCVGCCAGGGDNEVGLCVVFLKDGGGVGKRDGAAVGGRDRGTLVIVAACDVFEVKTREDGASVERGALGSTDGSGVVLDNGAG